MLHKRGGRAMVRRHLARSVWRCKGNVEAIARAYDVQHCTVRRWIVRMNLATYLDEVRAIRAPGTARKAYWLPHDDIAVIRAKHGLPPERPVKQR